MPTVDTPVVSGRKTRAIIATTNLSRFFAKNRLATATLDPSLRVDEAAKPRNCQWLSGQTVLTTSPGLLHYL